MTAKQFSSMCDSGKHQAKVSVFAYFSISEQKLEERYENANTLFDWFFHYFIPKNFPVLIIYLC